MRFAVLIGVLTTALALPYNQTISASSHHLGDADFEELHRYAHLSAVAYCLKKGLHGGPLGEQEETCPHYSCEYPTIGHLDVVKVFNFQGWLVLGSGFVALERERKRIYVVYRGTSSTQDWINNFEFLHSRYKPLIQEKKGFHKKKCNECVGCTIHKGFNTFIRSNAEEVVREIVKLKKKYPDFSLVVTGHSLGGALAILSGIEFRLLGFETLVVTLGGPKVGNEAFVDYVDELFDTENVDRHISEHHSFEELPTGLIRATHKHDIIPMLPPTSRYKQCGYQYYLSAKGARQTPQTMERRGTDYAEDDEDINYQSTLPSRFSRTDHVNYFFKITGCAD